MQNIIRKHPRHRLFPDRATLLVPLCLLLTVVCLSAFTGHWAWSQNPYNSYSLQANAWLHGQLDLGQDYPWLELAIYEGKYFVSFPPFPSYLLLPFVALFGTSTPDALIALIVSLIGIYLAVRITLLMTGPGPQVFFYPLFLYLGTGYLFIMQTGWVWFFAQTLCFTLCLAAIYTALHGRGGWALTFWACAVGCRPLVALFLPILFILLRRHATSLSIPQWIKSRLRWAIGPLLLAASYMILNFLRFGSPIEFGHTYLPEFQRAEHGQFSLTYLMENLPMLLRLPSYDSESGRLIFDHVETTLIFLENPMILTFLGAWGVALWRRRQEGVLLKPSYDWILPILLLVHMIVTCMHRTLGGFQYGNRYFLDGIPFLFMGLLEWREPDSRFDAAQLPLFFLGFTLSVLGTVCAYNGW